MRSLLSWISIVFLMLVSPLAQAVRVQSIYEAEIPVASQTEQEKAQAIQDALNIVLIKLSGNSHILENNPNLKSNIKNAEELVEDITYDEPEDAPEATPYLLFIRFNADDVNKLLRESGSLMWGEDRPLILAWLELQTPPHKPELVDNSVSNIPALLKKAGKERGLPIIFPMMDVIDLSEVSVTDLNDKSLTRLQEASKRYTSNAILVGKITQSLDEVVGNWQLVMGDQHWSWDVTGKSLSDVMTGIVDNVADTLASRYGVTAIKMTRSDVTVTIVGLKQRAELIRVIKYLETLSPGTEVQLQNISDKEVILNVSLQTSKESFMHMLASSKELIAVPTIPLLKGPLKYKLIK